MTILFACDGSESADAASAAAGKLVFSSMWEPNLVPGIGAMSSPASSQAKPIYPIFDEESAALDRA
jgi:hypothetical protein